MAFIINRVWITRCWRRTMRVFIALSCIWQASPALSGPRHVRRPAVLQDIMRKFSKRKFLSGSLQDHGIPHAEDRKPGAYAQSLNFPWTWWQPTISTISWQRDAAARYSFLCIQTGKKVSDENRMRYEGGRYYVKSEERDAGAVPVCAEEPSITPIRSLSDAT